MVQEARNLQSVNISNCPSQKQSCIFQVKEDLSQLTHLDISGNAKFTILAVACLRSFENLEILVAHGCKFSAEELLFLEKTCESISSGTLRFSFLSIQLKNLLCANRTPEFSFQNTKRVSKETFLVYE